MNQVEWLTHIYLSPWGKSCCVGENSTDSAVIYQSARQHLSQEQVLPDPLTETQKLVRVHFGRKRSWLNTNKD